MPHDHTHLETASSGVSGQACCCPEAEAGRQQRQRESWLKGPGGQSSQRFQPTLYRKWISALGHCVCSLASSPGSSATKSVSAMLIPDVSVPLGITRFQVPVPWKTLQLLADNVVPHQLPAYQYSPTTKAIFSSTAIFQNTSHHQLQIKKTFKTISFKLLVSIRPSDVQRYKASSAVLAHSSKWWHYHSSVITVLYLSDIQHRYHDNRKRTVQSHIYLSISSTQAHSRPTHRWPCIDFEHMYAHPDVRAQTGCLQQAHLIPMGSAAFTVLLTIQVFSSAALFYRVLALIPQESPSDNIQ